MYATLVDFYSLEISVRKTLTVATATAEKTIQEKRNITCLRMFTRLRPCSRSVVLTSSPTPLVGATGLTSWAVGGSNCHCL